MTFTEHDMNPDFTPLLQAKLGIVFESPFQGLESLTRETGRYIISSYKDPNDYMAFAGPRTASLWLHYAAGCYFVGLWQGWLYLTTDRDELYEKITRFCQPHERNEKVDILTERAKVFRNLEPKTSLCEMETYAICKQNADSQNMPVSRTAFFDFLARRDCQYEVDENGWLDFRYKRIAAMTRLPQDESVETFPLKIALKVSNDDFYAEDRDAFVSDLGEFFQAKICEC